MLDGALPNQDVPPEDEEHGSKILVANWPLWYLSPVMKHLTSTIIQGT